MANSEDTVENLRQQLKRLEIAASNIKRVIASLEEDPDQASPVIQQPTRTQPSSVLDRDGSIIKVGSKVKFLTKGRFSTTGGIVTRFSRRNERVFTRDCNGNEISRAPHNLRVVEL